MDDMPPGQTPADITVPLVATWDDVNRIATALPEMVEVGPHTWKVNKKLVVWERPLRAKDRAELGDAAPDGPILGAHVPDLGAKEALFADDPDVYFTTSHFNGYAAVLVKLEKISVPDLEELITEAWLDRAPKRLVKPYLECR